MPGTVGPGLGAGGGKPGKKPPLSSMGKPQTRSLEPGWDSRMARGVQCLCSGWQESRVRHCDGYSLTPKPANCPLWTGEPCGARILNTDVSQKDGGPQGGGGSFRVLWMQLTGAHEPWGAGDPAAAPPHAHVGSPRPGAEGQPDLALPSSCLAASQPVALSVPESGSAPCMAS